METKTKTPREMTFIEIIESLIQCAKSGQKEKVNQLLSDFEEKVFVTGRSNLRLAEGLIIKNEIFFTKDTFKEIVEKIKNCI